MTKKSICQGSLLKRAVSKSRVLVTGISALASACMITLSCARAESLEQVVARTDVIGSVTIQSGTSQPRQDIHPECGYAYTATVSKGILNVGEGELIEFRSINSLLLGGTYLLLLSDDVLSREESDVTAIGNARSAQCGESGISLVPVQFRFIGDLAIGDEVVFELRRVYPTGSTDEEDIGKNVFSAPKRVSELFVSALSGSDSRDIYYLEVQRGVARSWEVAINEEELLTVLANLVDGNVDFGIPR